MLTPFLKAEILRKTGVTVPAIPTQAAEAGAAGDTGADSHRLKQWAAAVETLFVSFVAARAAKSLRDAEEARQLDALQRISADYSGSRLQALRA